MKALIAFLNGVREFRSGVTCHYEDYGLMEAYDLGREVAHRATFRRFEP